MTTQEFNPSETQPEFLNQYAPQLGMTTDSADVQSPEDYLDLAAPLPKSFICFSHLRWDFVFQRPQHLLTRLGARTDLSYMEEPIFTQQIEPSLEIRKKDGISIVTPHLPESSTFEQRILMQRQLLNQYLERTSTTDFGTWYYTPMALLFSDHLKPKVMIYDCMDELSHFKGAPVELVECEKRLLKRADVVFTGGYSLYEAKKDKHSNIHPFPSSIDFAHFSSARSLRARGVDPADQKDIPFPRLGFYGVVDERFHIKLLGDLAAMRPEWHFVIIGPVVKIEPEALPRSRNIHYLGPKTYQELPKYLAQWDIALLPFEKNDSTKYISPTKTPEYLAAGVPVISTSIRDVVRPYATEKLVKIADTARGFAEAADEIFSSKRNRNTWLQKVDTFLAPLSWDSTFKKMISLAQEVHWTNNKRK